VNEYMAQKMDEQIEGANSGQELLPCPFCGGEATFNFWLGNVQEIYCKACLAAMKFRCDTDWMQESAMQWNCRSPIPPRQSEGRIALAAKALRDAQRAYMADRGNDTLGRVVARRAEELDSALAAQPVAQSGAPEGWQPIETAPKGRTILLGYFNPLGKWRTLRGTWITQDEIDDEWESGSDFLEGWYETSVEADDVPSCWPTSPTHWQPLPAPLAAAPTPSKQSKEGET